MLELLLPFITGFLARVVRDLFTEVRRDATSRALGRAEAQVAGHEAAAGARHQARLVEEAAAARHREAEGDEAFDQSFRRAE